MRRLIDANNLKHNMDKYNYSYFGANYEKILEVIDEEPTVDFVKRGHWIFRTDGIFNGMHKCSVCRDTVSKPSRYCPMCGARNEDEVTE